MKTETDEQKRPLRTGLTTGSCATACSVAAARLLFANTKSDSVEITLPKGKLVSMPITELSKQGNAATASTIKDGGDDPDATHGATLSVCLKLIPIEEARQQAQADLPTVKLSRSQSSENSATSENNTPQQDLLPVVFKAGEGVGSATREGLVIPVGQPAINPVPRKMIREHLREIAEQYNYQSGFEVTVSVLDGEKIALKTMNGRLGILGGISILGTTGIVRPFSCAAYIASIHQGIDVARSNGEMHLAACTGNSSESYIQSRYSLPEMALIEMGDFAGAVLKYLRHNPVKKLSICGGFGKLSKLANGHLDLHSRVSSIDFSYLAKCAESLGANEALLEQIGTANTSIEVLKLCQAQKIDLAGKVCADALAVATKTIKQDITVEVWAVNRAGEYVGHAQ
ncbi:cobalt-precorrin-5B (C(1))-methyltransferase [Leucothrix sargassi]|nr:cobalt-precorrin-5B (C(1))-methyltransferase [Leucothrix sargassi]